MSADPTDILARTLDGEAEGCGVRGMTAVCCVVLNRAADPGWWGSDIVSVCLAPYQFSCWLPGPDRTRIEALTPADPWFAIARSIAARAVRGDVEDITNGADSYYARSMREPPSWAASAQLVYEDDWHRFYRTVGGTRCVGHRTVMTADALNAAELAKIENTQEQP